MLFLHDPIVDFKLKELEKTIVKTKELCENHLQAGMDAALSAQQV